MSIRLHLEDGGRTLDYTGASYDVSADKFWSRKCTMPMLRADTRRIYGTDGTGLANSGDDGAGNYKADPVLWAQRMALRVQWFKTQTRSTYAAAKKTFRYSLMIEGPDGSASQLRLCRHPSDEIISGHAVYGGSGRASPFPVKGIAETLAWFRVAVPAFKSALDALGLPYPTIAWSNIESIGDIGNAAFLSDGLGGYTAGIWDTAINNSLANSYMIDGQRTLLQWAFERSTKLGGGAYPAFGSVSSSPSHVSNFDQVQRCVAMSKASYLQALYTAVFAPFVAAFPGIQTAEWNQWTESRSSPVFFASTSKSYDMNGFNPLTASCPANYSGLVTYSEGWYGTGLSDWYARYSVGSLASSIKLAAAGAGQLVEMAAQIKAAGGKVFPSVSLVNGGGVWTDLSSQEQAAVAYIVGQSMLDCAAPSVSGSTDAYVFQPEYAESSALRASLDQIAEMVDRLNPADSTANRSSTMGISFPRTTLANYLDSKDHDVRLNVAFGKSPITTKTGASGAAYVGTPTHGRPFVHFGEALSADNVASRFTNPTSTPANYANLNTSLGTFGSTEMLSKTWAMEVWFKINGNPSGYVALAGTDEIPGIQFFANMRENGFNASQYCCVRITRSVGNSVYIAVNTGGKHLDGQWHCLIVGYDHATSKWYLDFDLGTLRTTTANTTDATTNPWASTGTLSGMGNFGGNFYVGAVGNGSGGALLVAAQDVEIGRVRLITGAVNSVFGRPSVTRMVSMGRRALGLTGQRVYFPENLVGHYSAAKTQGVANLVWADSQTYQDLTRLSWIAGWQSSFSKKFGSGNAPGTWCAAMAKHQGSAVVAYDGWARGDIANGTSYASWDADLKALVPSYNFAVTDPDAAGNTSAVSIPGEGWVLNDGATVAANNASTYTITVGANEQRLDMTQPLRLLLTCYGKTSGSGSGQMRISLRNGADVLAVQTITCKGAAPAGARSLGGSWYEFDVVINIPDGARSSSTYTLYTGDGTTGSAGPCGIGHVQLALQNPVGISTGVFAVEGGRSLRYINRQLEDLGANRMASFIRAATIAQRAAGQTELGIITLSQGFNDLNDTNNSLTPDGTFTASISNGFDGMYQNMEWAMRFLESCITAAGKSVSNWRVRFGYIPSSVDAEFMFRTYCAALAVARDRSADQTKLQMSVFVSPEILRHADFFSATGPQLEYVTNDSVHMLADMALRGTETWLQEECDAISRSYGELNAVTAASGGRVSRVSRPTLT